MTTLIQVRRPPGFSAFAAIVLSSLLYRCPCAYAPTYWSVGRPLLHYSKRAVCPSTIPSGPSAPPLFQAGRLPLHYPMGQPAHPLF